MSNLSSIESQITRIRPKSGWQLININELKEYRDLFFFLVWRDIKVMYAQTIMGFMWAILQPTIQIIIFSIVFGKVARVSTEGIPYVLFSSVAIIPWSYMSQAMSQSSESLVKDKALLGKIYFPRLIFPMTSVLARLVDFGISMVIVFVIALYYHVVPTWQLAFFPLFLLMMMAISLGAGMWLSALAIRYRDVRYALRFLIQMFMYSAPIVYSASSIPEKYRFLYSLNPIVGVIEGLRASILGTPMPWTYILSGAFTTVLLLISGTYYFKRMERVFVDVI